VDILYQAKGKLHYSTSNGYKLIVECEQDIADMYRALVPKYYYLQRQRYPAHITVVRSYKEIPLNMEPWGKYDGEVIEYYYEPFIRIGTAYMWLNILCKRLEEIRYELGLPIRSEYTQPPEGFSKYFHMTIGNIKTT